MTFEAINWNKIEGIIDHQQAAVRAGAEAIMRAGGLERFLGTSGLYNLPVWLRAKRDSENALTAATPHLRAGMADEILDDTPGSPLTRGYQRLMDPKPGEHPVRTWEAAVRVMLDTLLEGGGACCEHSKCPGGSICCCQEGGGE